MLESSRGLANLCYLGFCAIMSCDIKVLFYVWCSNYENNLEIKKLGGKLIMKLCERNKWKILNKNNNGPN